MMFDILRSNGTTALEVILLLLFSITFIWITTAFWTGLLGFILQLGKIDPLTLKRNQSAFGDLTTPDVLAESKSEFRTAVVMPVYNEDTQRVIAGFEASLHSINATEYSDNFDFYLLSDTQDPDIRLAELDAWQALLKRLGNQANKVFYRNRPKNAGKKVGNLKDFCERWGGFYESMIVLDADSVMTGDCMVELAQQLHVNPKAGLLQTVPIPVRQETFFGRFLQFAAQLCCPMLATGLAFWQTDNANYWGHNAIIRISAFRNHCGLPKINKRSPFGGDILSHDFVEAALLRREGWEVILLPNLEGSYEEVPSNILDYATRDRRWIQGNIQHLGLLGVSRLTLLSKMHFLFGALAYITSLIWLVMLGLSTVDAITRALTKNEFFTSAHQLFPNWPIAKPDLIFSLLFLTFSLLLLPKVLAVILAVVHRRKEFGGAFNLLLGSVVEILFAIIIAPIMMVFHASFVVATFLGFKVAWNAQPREGRVVAWREAIKYSGLAALVAVIWGTVTAYYSVVFFYWLVPVLLGLVTGPLIIRWSSSKQLGLLVKKWGVFLTPSEVNCSPVLVILSEKLSVIHNAKCEKDHLDSKRIYLIPKLPSEIYEPMPTQKL
jgi:membrane glycosyltransferase